MKALIEVGLVLTLAWFALGFVVYNLRKTNECKFGEDGELKSLDTKTRNLTLVGSLAALPIIAGIKLAKYWSKTLDNLFYEDVEEGNT